MEIKKEKIKEALMKKAMGYNFEESVEEFSLDEENGKYKPCKKRISKKYMPPDISAMKALLSICDEDSKYDLMTEEELLIERAKLLEQLSSEK